MKSTGRKVLNTILSVILWIIILLAALFSFVTLATKDKNQIASIAGFSPLTVQTDSMKPAFSSGDLIIIKKCDPDTLEVGDIITFHTIIENQYALNTHRIKEITEENGIKNYVTKGDNNALEDTHIITGADIAGKYVTKIPLLGKIMNFISGTVGFLVCIVFPLFIFFIYQIYHLIMIVIEMKKAAAVEEAVTLEEEKAKKALEEANRLKAEAEEALAKAKAAQEKLKK